MGQKSSSKKSDSKTEESSETTSRRQSRGSRLSLIQSEGVQVKQVFILDSISFLIIAITFVYLSWAIVNFRQSGEENLVFLGDASMTVLILATVGMVFMLVTIVIGGSTRVELRAEGFQIASFLRTLTWSILGVIAVSVTNAFIFNSITPPKYATLEGTNLLLFSVTIAIAEEVLFTFLFQILFTFLFNNIWAGIIARSIGFGLYHYAVYGQNIPYFASTFLAGFWLALVLTFSGGKDKQTGARRSRITANIFVHVIMNSIASGLTF